MTYSKILKYVIVDDGKLPVIFSKEILHSTIAENLGKINSAGFCIIKYKNNNPEVTCYGRSSSLDLNSLPLRDSDLIKLMLKNDAIDKIEYNLNKRVEINELNNTNTR